MTALPDRNKRLTTPAVPLVVDVKRLAELLCVSVRHVERLDSAGKIPNAVHIGASKRWLVSEIDAWLKAGAPDRRTWLAMKAAGRP